MPHYFAKFENSHGWIHFTIQNKRAIDEKEAMTLPPLPSDWANEAVIL
jgi:hypothetical protein